MNRLFSIILLMIISGSVSAGDLPDGYISKDLYLHLSTELNNLQDEITGYCFLNKDGYNKDPAALKYSRTVAIQNLSNFMTNFLKGIQTTQESIG